MIAKARQSQILALAFRVKSLKYSAIKYQSLQDGVPKDESHIFKLYMALGNFQQVEGAGCRVQGAGCRVQGAGCRVTCCRLRRVQQAATPNPQILNPKP